MQKLKQASADPQESSGVGGSDLDNVEKRKAVKEANKALETSIVQKMRQRAVPPLRGDISSSDESDVATQNSGTKRKKGCSPDREVVAALKQQTNKIRGDKEIADSDWAHLLLNANRNVNKEGHRSTTRKSNECVRCESVHKELAKLREELLVERSKTEMLQKVLDKVSNIEGKVDSFCKPHAVSHAMSETTVCHGLQVVDDKVDLGQGVLCTKVCWEAMNSTLSIPNWCIALLRGHFGNEAMYYRVKPRTSYLKKFSTEFLNVATAYFNTSFLERRLKELKASFGDVVQEMMAKEQAKFFLENRYQLIQEVPARLSDRCFTMWKQAKRTENPGDGTTINKSNNLTQDNEKVKRPPRKLLTIPKALTSYNKQSRDGVALSSGQIEIVDSETRIGVVPSTQTMESTVEEIDIRCGFSQAMECETEIIIETVENDFTI